jgi:hypothetical protein
MPIRAQKSSLMAGIPENSGSTPAAIPALEQT